MSESNDTLAYSLLWPSDDILVRVVFLYVGQGASAVVFVKDGEASFQVLLVDINLDKGAGGIDVPALMKDLLGNTALDAFVNTHPHKDHLCGLEELMEAVDIRGVWETGFDPGDGEDSDFHQQLQALIKKVEAESGVVDEITGSRSAIEIGKAQYYKLSPASHVKDAINKEDGLGRRKRIHEHCAVLKFGLDDRWIMITGDADLVAWRDHITDYHKDRLPAYVLGAAHHGSRSFFMEDKDDDPYLTALETINPDWIIVSAPKVEESRHEHPHPEAMKLYQSHVGKKRLIHLGTNRSSHICDIPVEGDITVVSDNSELSGGYGLEVEEGENADTDEKAIKKAVVSLQHTKPITDDKHAQNPAEKWPRSQLAFAVEISASYHQTEGSQSLGNYPSDIIIPDGFHLKFMATIPSKSVKRFGHGRYAKNPFAYYWQVTNTGSDARERGQLRGQIVEGEATRWEHTSYTGRHWVRCFVVHRQSNRLIATSAPFYVNVLRNG